MISQKIGIQELRKCDLGHEMWDERLGMLDMVFCFRAINL
jgi:hypothetical protein